MPKNKQIYLMRKFEYSAYLHLITICWQNLNKRGAINTNSTAKYLVRKFPKVIPKMCRMLANLNTNQQKQAIKRIPAYILRVRQHTQIIIKSRTSAYIIFDIVAISVKYLARLMSKHQLLCSVLCVWHTAMRVCLIFTHTFRKYSKFNQKFSPSCVHTMLWQANKFIINCTQQTQTVDVPSEWQQCKWVCHHTTTHTLLLFLAI